MNVCKNTTNNQTNGFLFVWAVARVTHKRENNEDGDALDRAVPRGEKEYKMIYTVVFGFDV